MVKLDAEDLIYPLFQARLFDYKIIFTIEWVTPGGYTLPLPCLQMANLY